MSSRLELIREQLREKEQRQAERKAASVGDPERAAKSQTPPTEARGSARDLTPGEIVWLPAPTLVDAFKEIDQTIDLNSLLSRSGSASLAYSRFPYIVLPGPNNDATHLRLVVKLCTEELRKGLERLIEGQVKEKDTKWLVPDYNNLSSTRFTKATVKMQLTANSKKPFATGYIFLSLLPKCTIPINETPAGGFQVETDVQYSEMSVRALTKLVDERAQAP